MDTEVGMEKTHGGKREGAGRPPIYGEPCVQLHASVPASRAADISRLAQASGKSFSQTVRDLLDRAFSIEGDEQ
jgi:hypothetical protein